MFLDYSVHWPYNPPEPFLSHYVRFSRREIKEIRKDLYYLISHGVNQSQLNLLRSLYDGQINYFDYCLKELIEYIKSIGFYENTLLIITSDHGELLGEHGLLHHEFVLYDQLIKVPLIIKFPDMFTKGESYSGLVQTIDILPTLIDYLNIEWTDVSRNLQGLSLLKMIKNKQEREFTISERQDWLWERSKQKIIYLNKTYPNFNWEKYVQEIIALRTKEYKYIWSSKGRHELYNIKKDPNELNNIIDIDSRKANELNGKLNEWKNSFEHMQYLDKTRNNGLQNKRLRALGYI
jgi:arylsulfatase A-like enzyme